MRLLRDTDTHRRRTRIFVLLLCSLVFLFALAAKLAPYHPEPANKPIAATKVWQSIEEPAATMSPALAPMSLLWSAILALTFLPAAAFFAPAFEKAAPPLQSWFSPHLSSLPPPSL